MRLTGARINRISWDVCVCVVVPSPWCCSFRLWARRSPPPSPAAAPGRHSAPWSTQRTPAQQQRLKKKKKRKERERRDAMGQQHVQHRTITCNSPALVKLQWCNMKQQRLFSKSKTHHRHSYKNITTSSQDNLRAVTENLITTFEIYDINEH